MKKTCTKCGTEKKLDQFYKNKSKKDNLSCWCKKCTKKYKKEYHIKNKENINQKSKSWYIDNKEKAKDYSQQYYEENKEEILKKSKEYHKIYYQENKKNILNNAKKYIIKNRKKINKASVEKRKTNINFKITSNLRIRVWKALKGICKSKKTIELLSCSIEQLKQHLQSQFTSGMSWDNYGSWHVDHIRPCSKFNLSKESEQCKCFNFNNLQPLWAIDNIKKGNR